MSAQERIIGYAVVKFNQTGGFPSVYALCENIEEAGELAENLRAVTPTGRSDHYEVAEVRRMDPA